MIGRTLVLLAAIVATGVPVRAENNPLVGTWRLVSFDREIVATKEVVHAFGGHATGFSTYTADGRYISLIVDSTRKLPAQPMATDAEAISLYRTMNAYAGSYRVEGDTIIYHYDISMNQIGIGQDEKRPFKIEGDRLSYTTPPSPSPFLNNQIVSVSAVWERVK
jgi:Lipocalin-like domain